MISVFGKCRIRVQSVVGIKTDVLEYNSERNMKTKRTMTAAAADIGIIVQYIYTAISDDIIRERMASQVQDRPSLLEISFF